MRHSFKDITIKNFRGVDLLEINGFAKINLFVGANNVGKTSILEALFYAVRPYESLACGKPMLVCSGEGTPIVDFLSPIGCAKIITDRNIPDRTKAASEYLRQVSKEALSAMGAKGITVIRKEYSSEIVTKRYVELVESVVIKTIGLINSGKR